MVEKKMKSIQRTGYMSEIDQFLRDHDKGRQFFGASREREVCKHQRLFAKRDAVVVEENTSLWEKF